MQLQLLMLGQCLELWVLLCMNMNRLSPNPQHVAGDAPVSYDHEFHLDFPHACEMCTFGISSSSCEACEIYSKQVYFSAIVG